MSGSAIMADDIAHEILARRLLVGKERSSHREIDV